MERNGQISGDRAIESLTQIDRTATRLAAQVAELQDIASIRTGRSIQLTVTETRAVTLVRRVVEQYRETNEDRAFLLELPDADIVVQWDVPRMERVLQNLLTNAVKYSTSGTPITVSLRRDGDEIILSVRDQGIGIPARDLPRVFERYFRAGNVTDRVGGTGIGLAGVQQIVALHGGAVSVQSTEGKGTIFLLHLPVAAPEPNAL